MNCSKNSVLDYYSTFVLLFTLEVPRIYPHASSVKQFYYVKLRHFFATPLWRSVSNVNVLGVQLLFYFAALEHNKRFTSDRT